MPSLDTMMGGQSTGTIAVVLGGAQNSKGSLKVSGEVKAGFQFPWTGAMFNPGAGANGGSEPVGKARDYFLGQGRRADLSTDDVCPATRYVACSSDFRCRSGVEAVPLRAV